VRLQLRGSADDKAVQSRIGSNATYNDFSVLLTNDGEIYKANGERLLSIVRAGVSEESAQAAYPFLHGLRSQKTTNRGAFSAQPRWLRKRQDGVISNTNMAEAVRSSVVGYFDRYPRIPYCRETSLTSKNPKEWGACLPLFQEIAKLFEQQVPNRYKAQLEAATKTHPAYVIPKTPFTTITVNNCVAGGYHTDAGDYQPGFGVMLVLRRGIYRGCNLVFPKYRSAVDMQDRDVIFFDPHEVHGNVPFSDQVGVEGEDWERISLVLYFRHKMLDCLSPKEELARAKQRGFIAEVP
jgi:hypothetical protein